VIFLISQKAGPFFAEANLLFIGKLFGTLAIFTV
jgi:hypothetical protein